LTVVSTTYKIYDTRRTRVKYLQHAWSRSKLFRTVLISATLCALLLLAAQGWLLAETEFTPGEGSVIGIDLRIYINAAKHLQQRQDLYLKGSLDVMEDQYPYAPSFALAFIPSLWLPSFTLIAIVHTLLHIAAYVLLYYRWNRIFRDWGLERASEVLACTLPVWLIFSAFWGDLGYLNVYTIMALLGTLLIEAILSEQLGWSLLWLSIIIQIKPQWAFAAAVPLLLGRYRFFLKLLALAVVTYVAVIGIMMLVTGPAYVWQQYADYIQFLGRLSHDWPWRGQEAPYLGYNHSIKQTIVYLLGATPGAMNLATGIKVLLLVPLGLVSLRHLLRPIRQPGRDVPRLSLDLALALYMGAFIWLDVVWEVTLGIAVFVYLLATVESKATRIVIWGVFLPYALVAIFQIAGFAILGMNALDGAYILTDPSIYVPLIMIVILVFYAILIKRLWNRPAHHKPDKAPPNKVGTKSQPAS
jgi:hypothetical protein